VLFYHLCSVDRFSSVSACSWPCGLLSSCAFIRSAGRAAPSLLCVCCRFGNFWLQACKFPSQISSSLYHLQFARLRFDLRFILCGGLLQFHGTFLDTFVTSWLGYFRFVNSCCVLFFCGELGTVVKYFERNLRLPFTPPLVAVFGPSIGIKAG
jgi:hypothetical protein